MVVEITSFVEHKKKGYRFCESQLLFTPKADDITREQLDYFIKEGTRLLLNSMAPEMVKAGMYASKSNIIRAINKEALLFEVQINVLVNEDLVIQEYPETPENTHNLIPMYDDRWCKIIFPKGVHSIKYIYYCATEYTARFEVEGEYYYNNLHRRDWSDFQPGQKFYKFGDRIRFRHKHEILTGYICWVNYDHYVPDEEISDWWKFHNTYDVIVETHQIKGSMNDNDKHADMERPYTFLVYEDDAVHANDIIELLGNDAELVKEMLREDSYDYSNEYLTKIGVLNKEKEAAE